VGEESRRTIGVRWWTHWEGLPDQKRGGGSYIVSLAETLRWNREKSRRLCKKKREGKGGSRRRRQEKRLQNRSPTKKKKKGSYTKV